MEPTVDIDIVFVFELVEVVRRRPEFWEPLFIGTAVYIIAKRSYEQLQRKLEEKLRFISVF